MTPQEIASAVGTGMLAKDHASVTLGMRLTHISPGAAHMDMLVRPDMLNGFGTCHGGMITSLADSAFGFACNSYNELTVASGLSVDFVAPAYAGDVLTGIGILAGIAILAGAASDADKQSRSEPRYDDRSDYPQQDRPVYQDGNEVGSAVSVCTDAAERSAGNNTRVSEIRSVTRDGNGWRVEGDLNNDSFTCAATDGRVDYIRINNRDI